MGTGKVLQYLHNVVQNTAVRILQYIQLVPYSLHGRHIEFITADRTRIIGTPCTMYCLNSQEGRCCTGRVLVLVEPSSTQYTPVDTISIILVGTNMSRIFYSCCCMNHIFRKGYDNVNLKMQHLSHLPLKM